MNDKKYGSIRIFYEQYLAARKAAFESSMTICQWICEAIDEKIKKDRK